MAIRSDSDADEVMSEINVTPLVDVMLVLLVVFIITAPLLTNAIHVNLPETAATAPPTEQHAISVSVKPDGKIFLAETEVSADSLEQNLKSLHDQEPDLELHLSADTAVHYGVVAQVMAAIERAGVTRLAVLTQPQ